MPTVLSATGGVPGSLSGLSAQSEGKAQAETLKFFYSHFGDRTANYLVGKSDFHQCRRSSLRYICFGFVGSCGR
jgi:hypothetical protein